MLLPEDGLLVFADPPDVAELPDANAPPPFCGGVAACSRILVARSLLYDTSHLESSKLRSIASYISLQVRCLRASNHSVINLSGIALRNSSDRRLG